MLQWLPTYHLQGEKNNSIKEKLVTLVKNKQTNRVIFSAFTLCPPVTTCLLPTSPFSLDCWCFVGRLRSHPSPGWTCTQHSSMPPDVRSSCVQGLCGSRVTCSLFLHPDPSESKFHAQSERRWTSGRSFICYEVFAYIYLNFLSCLQCVILFASRIYIHMNIEQQMWFVTQRRRKLELLFCFQTFSAYAHEYAAHDYWLVLR